MEELGYPLPEDVLGTLAEAGDGDEMERKLKAMSLPDAIAHWPREACEDWSRAYLEDDRLIDVDEAASRRGYEFDCLYSANRWKLFAQILSRSSEHSIALDIAGNSRFIDFIMWGYMSIDVPRRYLAPAFLKWLEGDFVPGLATYHHQFFTKATAQEKSLACSKLLAHYKLDKTEFFEHVSMGVIIRELQTAWNYAPELVHTWCETILSTDGDHLDPEEVATVHRYQRMARDAAAGMPGLPDKTMRYLMLPHADRHALTEAFIEIADLDPETCSPLLRMARNIIERDSSLHRGKLPPHIDVVASPQAREVLQDYQRLRDMGGLSPVTACLLLTSALEIQLRFILRKVEGASKATLGELRERWSQRRSAANRAASPQYDHALENAVRIRNHAHHSPNKVCPDDAEYLHRNLFEPAKEVGILAVIFRDG